MNKNFTQSEDKMKINLEVFRSFTHMKNHILYNSNNAPFPDCQNDTRKYIL